MDDFVPPKKTTRSSSGNELRAQQTRTSPRSKSQRSPVPLAHEQNTASGAGTRRPRSVRFEGVLVDNEDTKGKSVRGRPAPSNSYVHQRLLIRCNPGEVLSLFWAMSPMQRQLVVQKGFQSLLQMEIDGIEVPSLLRWLLDRTDPDHMIIDAGAGKELHITKDAVRLILGLPSAGAAPEHWTWPQSVQEAKLVRAALNCKGALNFQVAVQRIMNGGEDDLTIRCFVMVLVNRLLMPSASSDITNKQLMLTRHLDRLSSYDWCQIVFNHLVHSVKKWHGRDKDNQAASVSGCCIVLLILYLDHLDTPLAPADRFRTPRFKYYNSKRILDMAREDRHSGVKGPNKYGKCHFVSRSQTCYAVAPGAAPGPSSSIYVPRITPLLKEKLQSLPRSFRRKMEDLFTDHDQEVDRLCASIEHKQINLANTFGEMVDEMLRANDDDGEDAPPGDGHTGLHDHQDHDGDGPASNQGDGKADVEPETGDGSDCGAREPAPHYHQEQHERHDEDRQMKTSGLPEVHTQSRTVPTDQQEGPTTNQPVPDLTTDTLGSRQNLGAESGSRKRKSAEHLKVPCEHSQSILKEIEDLRAQLDEDVKKLGYCEANQKLRVELTMKVEEMQCLRKQNEEMQGRSNGMRKQNEKLQAMNDGLAKQNKDLQAKNDGLVKENEELRTNIDSVMKRNGVLQVKNGSLTKWSWELQAKNGGLAKQIEELQAKNDGLMKENEELQAKHAALVKQNEEVQTNNDSMRKRNGELQAKNCGLTKHNEELQAMNDSLTKWIEELEANNDGLEDLNGSLVRKERQSNDELQQAQKELTVVLEEKSNGQTVIEIKRMGELDEKPFQNACKRKYGNDDYQIKAAELVAIWRDEIKKPSWHPFMVVQVNGEQKEVVDDNDAKLKLLRFEYGDDVCNAVKTALMEINKYSPSERCAVPQFWNFKKGRKATTREVLKYLF